MNLIARAKASFSKTRFANPDSAARQISLIAGGTIIAQAIGILTMPIVSRIYSPADYGIMAIYTSVLAILTELSGFRYYLAIPLPKDERYANALVVLSLGIQITFALLLSVLLFFAGEFILAKLSIQQLTPYRLLLPVGLLGAGTYIVLTQWAIRKKLFSTVARTRITQSLSGTFANITLGLMGIRPLGLLIGAIIAQGGGISTLACSLLKKKDIPRPKKVEVRRAVLRYRKFPLYTTWTGLLNSFGKRVVPIVLAAYYTPRIAGLFVMAESFLGLPSSIVGSAIGQVFTQQASVAKYNGDLEKISFDLYKTLIDNSIFPMLAYSFIAFLFLPKILGSKWIEVSFYIIILSVSAAFGFVYSPFATLYYVLDRQILSLLLEVFRIAVRLLSLWAGSYFSGAVLSVLLFSITNAFFAMFKVFYIMLVAGVPSSLLFTSTLMSLLESCLFLVVFLSAFYLSKNMFTFIPLCLLICCAFSLRRFSSLKKIL